MKLTILLMTVSLMQVTAATFGQNFTLKENRISLERVFNEIRKQTGYDVFLSSDEVKLSTKIKVDIADLPLGKAIDKILEGLPLTYTIEQNTIVITEVEKDLLDKVFDYFVRIDVGGRVIDKDGNPLAGASVTVKGEATARTTTNSRGEFTLFNINENAILQVNYIGYSMSEVKAGSSPLTVVLESAYNKLDEVQVVGYGTSTQRLGTGSVGTITATTIEKQPINNILDALVGRIAGLQVTQTSGIQGAAPRVKIRGVTNVLSSTSTDPLYIVDGVPTTVSRFLSYAGATDNQAFNYSIGLNTDDIESVSVLKDADATSIYGSRGTNGVILITTKRGKAGQMRVNLKAYTGVQKVANRITMLDVNQRTALRQEAFANDQTYGGSTVVPTVTNAPDLLVFDRNASNNWQDLFIGETAVSNDLGLSFSGGSENTRYFVSGGYHKEGSVMPGDSRSIRKSIAANINSTSDNKKLTVEARTSYSESSLNLLPADMVGSIFLAPNVPIYKSDGSPNWDYTNFPYANTLQNYFAPTRNFGINGLLGYEFIPGLKARISGGLNSTTLRMSQEIPVASLNPTTFGGPVATLNKQSTDNTNWIIEPQLEYIRSIKKHDFHVLLGSTFQESEYSSLGQTGTGFANDNLISNLSSAAAIATNTQFTPYTYNAFFGRLSYTFNQEVLANVNFRRDGSSRFGEGHRFGNFGAVGLGWIFTERQWLKDKLPFLSFGKIRGSYGTTGSDALTDFSYLNTYSPIGATTGYNGAASLQASGLPNPDLHWETTKKMEAALELGFFNDRVLFSGAYFRNRTKDLLVQTSVSGQTGYFFYTDNFGGVVQNKGYEFELSTKNIQGAFSWNTSLNYSKSDNLLVSYPNFANSGLTFRLNVGSSLNVVKAYRLAGLNAKGVPVYNLANGTTGANPGNNDRAIIGDTDPRHGGISNDFSYKGFNFNFFVSYERQFGVPQYIQQNLVGQSQTSNYNTYVLGRWQKPGDEANTIIPRFTNSFSAYESFYYFSSDRLYKNRHIFRLSNASLGYTLPSSIISKVKLSRAQVYVNGQNLYVFDKHKDKELNPLTGNSSLPPLRTIVFGINASF